MTSPLSFLEVTCVDETGSGRTFQTLINMDDILMVVDLDGESIQGVPEGAMSCIVMMQGKAPTYTTESYRTLKAKFKILSGVC